MAKTRGEVLKLFDEVLPLVKLDPVKSTPEHLAMLILSSSLSRVLMEDRSLADINMLFDRIMATISHPTYSNIIDYSTFEGRSLN